MRESARSGLTDQNWKIYYTGISISTLFNDAIEPYFAECVFRSAEDTADREHSPEPKRPHVRPAPEGDPGAEEGPHRLCGLLHVRALAASSTLIVVRHRRTSLVALMLTSPAALDRHL
jgi:hypothetical protein